MTDTEEKTPAKKITRKKAVPTLTLEEKPQQEKKLQESTFAQLILQIQQAQDAFITLLKEIAITKESWEKEKIQHEKEMAERNQQEEITRKREQETYDYETAKERRKAEDIFTEKKSAWEKDLASRKTELEEEKKELESLRKQVSGFDAEKEKAVKQAEDTLRKNLLTTFEQEKKLREQEVKAEKDMLGLKITNLTQEASRQAGEIEQLKKALDDATRQLKDVAVKVIEAGNGNQKSSMAEV